MVKTTTKPVIQMVNDIYPFYLAVSSDCLLVVNDKHELVEWVVKGKDTDAYLCSSPDEETFLENLLALKECILSGKDPFEEFDFD
jgi:hypothetical protein